MEKKLTTRRAVQKLLAQVTEEQLLKLYEALPEYRPLIEEIQAVISAEEEGWRLNAITRWGKRTPEQRRAEMKAAFSVSPRTMRNIPKPVGEKRKRVK